MSSRTFEIRAATPGDREAILALLRHRWGGETMVVHDTVYRPTDLPAFVAVDGPEIVGLVTYEPGSSWHVLSLDSLIPAHGISGALLDRVEAPLAPLAPRVTLVTTNDNVDAIRFYPTTWLPHRLRRSRRRRPRAKDKAVDPLTGYHGIPIRDEITLVKNLAEAGNAASGGAA